MARHKILTGVGAFVLLLIVIGALNGGNDDEREAPVAAATSTNEAQEEEKTAEEIAADEEAEAQAEAERQAEEEAEAAASAEEERLAEEQRLADEAAAAAEAARIGTVAQQNAYRSAVDYLDYMSFSRTGLVGQLAFEGFSAGDAEFGIARLEVEGGVDWNAQAAASAADYLTFMSFSHSGLVDQLIFEGFTPDQAEYGVSTTGL